MIKDVIAESTGDVTMLLDGFPRNVAQAEILEKTGAEIRSVVLLDVPDAIIQDRIAGRRGGNKGRDAVKARVQHALRLLGIELFKLSLLIVVIELCKLRLIGGGVILRGV